MNISDALIQTYTIAGRLPEPAAQTLIRDFHSQGRLSGPSLGVSLTGAAAFVGRTIRDAARWYLARRRRAAAIRDLSGLDDRTLKDIGVPRSEIAAIVDAVGTPGLHPVTLAGVAAGLHPVTLAGVAVGSAPRLWASVNDNEAPREAA